MVKPSRIFKTSILNFLSEENSREGSQRVSVSRSKIRRERVRQMVLRSIGEEPTK